MKNQEMALGQDQVPSAFRLSTEALPEPQRLAFWREEFGRVMLKVDVDPIGSDRFTSEVTLRTLPGLNLFSGETSSVHFRAPPSLAITNEDTVGISRMLRNTAVVSQRGLETTIAQDNAALLSVTEPIIFSVPLGGHTSAVRLSRPVLQALVPGLEDAYNKVIPGDNGALNLLFSYINVLEDQTSLRSPGLQPMLVTHIYDLAALALGAGGGLAWELELWSGTILVTGAVGLLLSFLVVPIRR